ncbi:MAG TPA: glycosyltransferase family 2 protein [Roseivirga sp.]
MSRLVKISGVIITYNEERNIGRCLESLKDICDEIIVVDSFSSDDTERICKEFDVRFIQNEFKGHIQQKNFAVDQAKNDIILSLDADEALSPELTDSIRWTKNHWENSAYEFNRHTNYCGQWIKHCGWYPDTKIRLWDRKIGRWGGINPHDSVEIQSAIQPIRLKGDLLHYSYYTIEEHILRSAKYAKISAQALNQMGKKASILKMLGSSGFRFIQDYFFRLGFLDGFYGLLICATNSHSTFLKYAYLRSLNKGFPIE